MRDLSTTWLAAGALILSLTLQLSDGFYVEPALGWLGLALVAVLFGGSGVPWPAVTPQERNAATRTVLTLGVLGSAVALVSQPVGWYMTDGQPLRHPWFLGTVAMMVCAAVLGGVRPHGRLSRLAVVVLLAGGLWIGAWVIGQSPNPRIDVIPVHADAFRALANGESPYGITFTDIYAGNEAFYAPEMRQGQRVLFGFPYPPLSLFLAWPGHALFGDLRYAEVMALVGAAALLAWMGRGGIGVLCAGALLLAPRVGFQIEQGWTEPFPMFLLAATVATALARPGLAWLPLGLLLAVKQHMVLGLLFVPMLIPASPWRERAWFGVKAVAVAAAVTVPLALLDVEAFIRSAVLLQLREPFRLDSLSFTRTLVALGWPLDKNGALGVSLVAGALGLVLSWWRMPRTPAGFAGSMALTCFLLTAFGKKAFLNYYFLVMAFLLVAVAAYRAPGGSSLPSTPARASREKY